MIGTTVSFKDEYGYVRSGEVLTIDSDKFDDIKWDEVPKYWSKKTKSYRPVKEKDMETVYIEIEGREYLRQSQSGRRCCRFATLWRGRPFRYWSEGWRPALSAALLSRLQTGIARDP